MLHQDRDEPAPELSRMRTHETDSTTILHKDKRDGLGYNLQQLD